MRATCCAILALVCGSSASAAIVNGDFETGDLSGWTVDANSGSVGIETENGSNAVKLAAVFTDATGDSGPRISQTFTVTLDANEYAVFSYDARRILGPVNSWPSGIFAGSITGPENYALHGGDHQLLYQVGVMILGHPNHPGFDGGWNSNSIVLNTSGEYTFSMWIDESPNAPGAVAESDWTLFVDNVSVVTVPEPASWLLSTVGLSLVTHWGIRRSRSAAKS